MGAISRLINYRQISESQTEFQRKDYWMMRFVRYPSGVYWPGQDLLDIRCNTFDPGIQDDPQILSHEIRGYTVKQGARPQSIAGTATIELIDRVDQTMSYFIDQWKLAAGDRNSLQGLAKEFYTADIEFTLYNIAEKPIRRITLENCMPPTGALGESGTAEAALFDPISASIEYESFTREWLNKGI